MKASIFLLAVFCCIAVVLSSYQTRVINDHTSLLDTSKHVIQHMQDMTGSRVSESQRIQIYFTLIAIVTAACFGIAAVVLFTYQYTWYGLATLLTGAALAAILRGVPLAVIMCTRMN